MEPAVIDGSVDGDDRSCHVPVRDAGRDLVAG